MVPTSRITKSSLVRVSLAWRRLTLRPWKVPPTEPSEVAFCTKSGPLPWFSSRLEMLVQGIVLLLQTVVACGLTWLLAEAAVAPASPRAVLTATDAASTVSPLMERLRMVFLFLWVLGRPPSSGGLGGQALAGRLLTTAVVHVLIPPLRSAVSIRRKRSRHPPCRLIRVGGHPPVLTGCPLRQPCWRSTSGLRRLSLLPAFRQPTPTASLSPKDGI